MKAREIHSCDANDRDILEIKESERVYKYVGRESDSEEIGIYVLTTGYRTIPSAQPIPSRRCVKIRRSTNFRAFRQNMSTSDLAT